MSVGLVVVSHSERLAAGVVELAAQMAPDIHLLAAGGADDGSIGTSFDKVSAALAEAETGDGVVVLCDLGSAVMTAETAVEFLDEPAAERARIADAPLVEGAVAAAVAAATGAELDAVLAAAEGALRAPDSHSQTEAGERGGARTRRLRLVNASGLHARPAAELVKLASQFAATITVNDVDASSLLSVLALGLEHGAAVELSAAGEDADAALDAVEGLIASGFGE